MKYGSLLTGILAASLSLSQLSYAGDQPKPLFAAGEKLHYKGYVLGWIPVGDAWFKIRRGTYNGKDTFRFDARALGRYLIYTLDIRISSFVDAATLRSVEFRRREVGTEKREYCVLFDRKTGEATYRRKTGEFETAQEMSAAPWETRRTFPVGKDVNDILYTLYFARNIGDRVGDKRIYRFVEKDYIWTTTVTIVGEKKVSLGTLGTFDALKVAIEPDYSEQKDLGEKFRGLFGVEGSMELWVEKKTRIPLIVQGQVPFAYIFNPTVTVLLQDYEDPSLEPMANPVVRSQDH